MSNDQLIINVNMADIKIASAPAFLRTVLGSCIGIFFYEPKLKIGGLAHIMLPDHPENSTTFNAAKFASSAVPALIDMLQKEGAVKKNLICKICGGSRMFAGFSVNSVVDVGARNQAATLKALQEAGIRVAAKDLGGETGRKIIVDLSTGNINISHFQVGEKVI